MLPHEQRVVDEKQELDARLAKLVAFIDASPIFAGLAVYDQALLRLQQKYMDQYSNLLGERIERFALAAAS